ncbi:hypothetical protein G7Y89_g13215 [Cudoniella acicularis]|uniref:Enoyl reductase (ER) domain-containing protein n=1 Tax=Cudoniella acicularis TaxID=354080 RepID=A0A8H4VWM8_9HELO|nr:hypothetical protein G7Y89_g13215 [Cudoniella acicularis]
MSTQRALVVESHGTAKVVSDFPIPQLRDDYLLIRVVAVALNPTDWNHIDWFGEKGALVGTDYAGTVEEVGSAVTSGFKKGDRVSGVVHGTNSLHHEDGAFAQYITAKADIQMKIPDNISFEEAAAFNLGTLTVGQALYQSLGLLPPFSPSAVPIPILIYGGSTATGLLAIQFAKLSGYTVYTTASPQHNELLKSLGATEVFDYSSPTCAQDIFAATNGKLQYVFDCISTASSAAICSPAMSHSGGKYTATLPVTDFPNPRDNISNTMTLSYTGIGERFFFGPHEFAAKKDDFDFGVKHVQLSAKLLQEKKLVPIPIEVRDGDLEGISLGLDNLRKGEVRGKKLVYRIK